jgi:nucleotide-binding universal stress UspA family protein
MSDTGIEAAPAGAIVVGVDGSKPSLDALRWAGRQAELTGSPLVAVIAWHYPTAYWTPAVPEGVDFGGDAKRALDKAVDEAFDGKPPVPVTTVVAEGSPAYALISIAAKADLIVVGSRGHGAFSGMLLGSVSEHAVTNADCPVVVVRHPHHAS